MALNEAHHCAAGANVRRIIARGVLTLTFPCAVLMTYWQLIPDRRWIRFDIANIALLCLMSFGMFLHADVWKSERGNRTGQDS